MNKVKALIPNGLTSLNLVFGTLSLMSTMEGNFTWASIYILLALVADGLDGRSARALGVSSEIGKELDSLCDCGSFGVAPAILAYQLQLHNFGYIGIFAALMFAVCGALRLARFNVNTDVVHGYFMGLAIPAGGCLIATSTLLLTAIGFDFNSLGYAYPVLVMITGYMMVSEVHYPDFKGAGEKIHLISKVFGGLVFAGIIFVGISAPIYAVLFGIFASYALFGIVNHTLTILGGSK